MNQSGRISILALASVFCVVAVVLILVFSKESPTAAGDRFMFALWTKDVDTLTKMSMIQGKTPDQIRKEWDTSCNVAGKYYLFTYQITGGSQSGPDAGAVRMQFVKDAAKQGSYPEGFELPMVKVDGQWKVDVRSISHEFYPALPR